jgi:hypothetical protein
VERTLLSAAFDFDLGVSRVGRTHSSGQAERKLGGLLAGSEVGKLGPFLGSLPFDNPYPPPPRGIGIIALAGNREKILGLQSLAGKIFRLKELGAIAAADFVFA